MPRGDAIESSLLRQLLYGATKMGKTLWIMRAAEFGYNVHIIDGDDGWHTISEIKDPVARSRINIIDVRDTFDRATFAFFMALVAKGDRIVWDEQTSNVILHAGQVKPDHTYFGLDFRSLGPMDIVVLDSWTALVRSLNFRFAIENAIDLSDAKKPEWDGYGWEGRLASFLLKQMHALPCHFVMTGHIDNAEKRQDKEFGGKVKSVVVSTKQQIKSVSANHATQIGQHFSDILFFDKQGARYTIDTSGDKNREGGSRHLPGKVWSNDGKELTFQTFIDASAAPKILLPQASKGIVFYPRGEVPDFGLSKKPAIIPAAVLPAGTIASTAAAPAQVKTGMAALLAKKPAAAG